MRRIFVALMLMLTFAVQAGADDMGIGEVLVEPLLRETQTGEAFRYVTTEGVVSYTDDQTYIPRKYVDSTEIVKLRSIKDYKRHTLAVTPVVSKRLDHLREMNSAALTAELDEFTAPYFLTREMRWVDGLQGAPGLRYASFDVLYDSEGRVMATALSDIGLDGSLRALIK